MSYSITTDIVPFVKHSVFETDYLTNSRDNEYFKLTCPEMWVEDYGPEEWMNNPEDAPLEMRGWLLCGCVDVGKRGNVFGYKWCLADNKEVFVVLVNESEYSNVGPVELAVVAENPDFIQRFLDDFEDLADYPNTPLEHNDVVKIYS